MEVDWGGTSDEPSIGSATPERPDHVSQWTTNSEWATATSGASTGIAETNLPGDVHEVEPPSDWESYSICDWLIDTDAECALTVNPLTEDQFWADIEGAPMAEIIDVQNGGTAGRQMIRRAWAMVLHALGRGLGEWAYCWFAGDWQGPASDESACILRHFGGGSTDRVEVTFDDTEDAPGPMSATRDTAGGPGTITVFRQSISWQQWHLIWTSGYKTDRYCVAMNIAQVLFHEMIHVCDGSSIDDLPLAVCYESYVVGSVFSFALAHLHPYTMESECCRNWWVGARSAGGTLSGSALFGFNEWSGIPMEGDIPDDSDSTTCWKYKSVVLPAATYQELPHSDDDSGSMSERPDYWSTSGGEGRNIGWNYIEIER